MTDAPKSVGVKRTTGYADNYWGVLTHIFDDGAVEYTRADLADAEIEHLRLSLSEAIAERDAAFEMSKCECGPEEACRSIVEARATGRREGMEEAAKIVEEDTRPALARTYRHNPVWFVYAKQRAAAIRAAMEK